MNEEDLRLDGNAAAGVLSEVFAAEMTAAIGECAQCGATNALGTVQVYAQGPGTVLRCPACTNVLMTIVRAPQRLYVDLSGVRRFEIGAA